MIEISSSEEIQQSSLIEADMGFLECSWKEFNIDNEKEVCYVGELGNDVKDFQQQPVQPLVVEKSKNHNKELLELPTRNRMDQVADDIMMRFQKYGRLDVDSKIARKTGAYKKDEINDREINYYDQDDPFIDDSEQEKQLQNKMALPETKFADFFCFSGDLKQMTQANEYKERLQVMTQITKGQEKTIPRINEIKSKTTSITVKKTVKQKQQISEQSNNCLDSLQCQWLNEILNSIQNKPEQQNLKQAQSKKIQKNNKNRKKNAVIRISDKDSEDNKIN